MKLPRLQDFNLERKTVLVRADFDVPLKKSKIKNQKSKISVGDDTRLRNCLETIKYLLERDCRVVLLGHLGRPGRKPNPNLSLKPVAKKLQELLPKINLQLIYNLQFPMGSKRVVVLENLRFWPGEEADDERFAKKLSSLGDFYVNECFSTSHRKHASFVGIPKFLPHAVGFHLQKEVEVLSQVLENPRRPVVIVIGGAKEDKLKLIPKFLKIADFILIGGWLLKKPRLLGRFGRFGGQGGKKIFACLTPDGKDITVKSAKKLAEIIGRSGTVVWSGPMGIYEDGREIRGTKIIAEAIADSKSFKIAGGGDTEAAIDTLGLKEKFDWISLGGGAMLQFLAEGTLPGIEALKINLISK